MAVCLEILPFSDSLDMFGNADRHSAYSLDGSIDIKISSPFNFFARRQRTRILLQSLKLVFEGSTAVLGSAGFSASRLCSVERELIDGEPVEMHNEGMEDSNVPCSWNVLYNLPIPGWLPPSSLCGENNTHGTRYALYATAKFIILDEPKASFFSLCIPSQSRLKTAKASTPIDVRRLAIPSAPGTAPPMRTYLLDASRTIKNPRRCSDIPLDIISKVNILVSVPQVSDMAAPLLDFTLRFRAPELDEASAARLHVQGLRFKLTQTERLRSTPSESYLRRYPMPAESSQPPNIPLRDLNTFLDLASLDLLDFGNIPEPGMDSKTYSLLPSTESGKYSLGDSTQVFKNISIADSNTWYSMEFTMPITRKDAIRETKQGHGISRMHATTEGAIYDVFHTLSVMVECMYEMDDGTKAYEHLKFSSEVVFTHFAPLPEPTSVSLTAAQIVSGTGHANIPALLPSAPYATSLPVYSQLYDPNGDRKVDYAVPLPLYTPLDSASSSEMGHGDGEWKETSDPSDSEDAPLLS